MTVTDDAIVPIRPAKHEFVVLVDTENTAGRRIVAGIAKSVREHFGWRLVIAPRDQQWRLRVPENWKGDGLITAIRDELTAQHVRSLNLPTVNVSAWGAELSWCTRVATDDRARAVLAWEHLRHQGYERFGYYAPPSQRYSEERGRKFVEVLAQAGYQCNVYLPDGKVEDVTRATTDWLSSLTYPIAIFAADPHPALRLTELCRDIGLRVPQDVAILAGDNDDLLCQLADPPISSVELASEKIGAVAVEQLSSLMFGPLPTIPLIRIPPLRVIERRSTAMIASSDPLFLSAVQYIRAEAHRCINVADILRNIPISRRMLEQRFAAVLGSSPAAEIRRLRIEKVKELLATSELTITQVSYQTGFTNPSQLSLVFRSETGVTPIEFRENLRRSAIRSEQGTSRKSFPS